MTADQRSIPGPLAIAGYAWRRAGFHLFRLSCEWKARRRHVPGGPAVFAYGHSHAALEGAKLTPWPVYVADGLGLPLVDRAVGGDMIRHTVRRAKVRRARPGPTDVVLVHIGGNDILRRGDDPGLAAEVRRSLGRIKAQLERAGATVHILAEVPFVWETLPRGFDHGTDEAYAAVHAAALSFPGAIDLEVGWDRTTMLLDDGIHPNELGVAALTSTILDGLRAADA